MQAAQITPGTTQFRGVSISVGMNPMAGLGGRGTRALRMDAKGEYERIARVKLMQMGFKEDAGQTAAFARQLEHIIAKVYAAEFAQYKAYSLFPVNTEVGPGDLSYTYRMISRTGNAAVVNAGNSKDLPNADIEAEEWQQQVITLGISYNFTVVDQASAQKAQIAIEAEKAKSAREAIEALEESIACTGYAATGTVGVTNAPGVAQTSQVSTGTWSAQLKTALATAPSTTVPYPAVGAVSAIASDILAMKQSIYSSTLGRHKATTGLLPPNLYGMLDGVPRSPAFTDDGILAYLERVTGLEIDDWAILQSAGSVNGSGSAIGSADAFKTLVMVYEKNPDVVQLMVAQPFVQLAPQLVGLAIEIPAYSRIGGAMAVRPLGIRTMAGLLSNVAAASDADAYAAGRMPSCLGEAQDCRSEHEAILATAY